MNELIAITLGYSVVFFLTIFFMSFLTNGFIIKFIIAKAGRGSKALIEVYGVANNYFKVGRFDGDILIYKNAEGKQKRILIQRDSIVRKMGVPSVSVDDEYNIVLKPDFKGVEGFDAVKFDNFIVRALTMPQIENQKEKIIVIIVLIAMIGALAFLGFKIINIETMISNLAGRGVIN